MYFSDGGMRQAVGSRSKQELLEFAKEKSLKSFEIFRNDQGFHSTTQDEFLIGWYDETGRNYWSNIAKKSPKLLKKQIQNLN